MIKLIVFDCDGVMFDSRGANESYYNHLLNHFGHPQMKEPEVEYVHMHSVTDSIGHIFRHYPDSDFSAINNFRIKAGYDPFLPLMKMEEDLVEFLEQCYGHYHLAISTNRTNTMVPLLQQYKIDRFFGKVMTAANATRPKPAPDALIEIMDHYGCDAEETIFIGDSTIDRDHSAACQVQLIAFKNRNLDAEFHVSCFMDIFSLPPLRDSRH